MFTRQHYNDVITGMMASQITSLTIVYSTVYSGADQRKYQSSASLVIVWGIHRGLVNSPHKWPDARKIFKFDDVIMKELIVLISYFVANRTPILEAVGNEAHKPYTRCGVYGQWWRLEWLHSSSLVALRLSVSYAAWLPIGWHQPFAIGRSQYTFGLRQSQWTVDLRDRWKFSWF